MVQEKEKISEGKRIQHIKQTCLIAWFTFIPYADRTSEPFVLLALWHQRPHFRNLALSSVITEYFTAPWAGPWLLYQSCSSDRVKIRLLLPLHQSTTAGVLQLLYNSLLQTEGACLCYWLVVSEVHHIWWHEDVACCHVKKRGKKLQTAKQQHRTRRVLIKGMYKTYIHFIFSASCGCIA